MKVTIQVVSGHPRYHFRVRFTVDGKPRFRYFPTRAKAQDFARVKKSQLERGPLVARITDQEAAVIDDAKQRLAHFGKTIRDAVTFYLDHLERELASSTIAELAEAMLEERDAAGLAAHHLQDWKGRLSRFSLTFGDRPAAAISTEEISGWLIDLGKEGLTAQTALNYRRAIHALFEFGRKSRGLQVNPVTNAWRPKVIRSDIGILTVDQSAKLMQVASKVPNLAPILALQLFGGMRREEVLKIQWEQIYLDEGFINVTPDVGKGHRPRHIDITDSLRSFLLPEVSTGPVVPSQQRLRLQLQQARKAADIKEWPHNCLRHSFASYHVALHESADKTALQLGHTDTQMLFQRYRALVRKDEALKFWAIHR